MQSTDDQTKFLSTPVTSNRDGTHLFQVIGWLVWRIGWKINYSGTISSLLCFLYCQLRAHKLLLFFFCCKDKFELKIITKLPICFHMSLQIVLQKHHHFFKVFSWAITKKLLWYESNPILAQCCVSYRKQSLTWRAK